MKIAKNHQNPSNGEFKLHFTKSDNYQLILRNLIGQQIETLSINGELSKQIQITDLNTGIYILTIKNLVLLV